MMSPSLLPCCQGRLRLPQGSLFWHEAGQGPAVVMLHGTWCDSRQWLPLVPHLNRHHHCLVPDLPGWGESTLTSPGSVALLAEALAHWLAALRLSQVYLVAHSVGAWVALHYALRYPQQVLGIVVIDPEGLAPPALAGRWRRDRGLSQPWLPLGLLNRLGFNRRRGLWGRWLDRYHLLQQYPMARRLLFQRRWREVKAEQLDAQLSALTVPILALSTGTELGNQLTRHLATLVPASVGMSEPEANELGLNHQGLATAIGQFIAARAGEPSYDLTATDRERRFTALGSSFTTESA